MQNEKKRLTYRGCQEVATCKRLKRELTVKCTCKCTGTYVYRFMPTVKIAAKNITKGFQSYRVCKQMT